jgi:hypothetical protein
MFDTAATPAVALGFEAQAMCTLMFLLVTPPHDLGFAELRPDRPPTGSTVSACDLPLSNRLTSFRALPDKLLLIPLTG